MTRHSQTDIVSRFDLPLVDGWPVVGFHELDLLSGVVFGRFGTRSLHFHSFVDDWRLESCWRDPGFGLHHVMRSGCVAVAPDYSVFVDDPLPFAIYQMWRSRIVAAVWASYGCRVVPCVQFGNAETLPFSVRGVASGSVLAVRGPSTKVDLGYWRYALRYVVGAVGASALLVFGRSDSVFASMSCPVYKFPLKSKNIAC